MSIRDINGDTPLHVAASFNFDAIVTMLLDVGAELDAVSPKFKYTPLGLAASAGAVATVKVLVARGAAVNPREVRELLTGLCPAWDFSCLRPRLCVELYPSTLLGCAARR
jgi:ankyrin repeat protein